MSGTYAKYPASTSQAIPTVATAANLPAMGAYDGQVYLTLDTDSLYAWNQGGAAWVLLNSASTVTGTGANGKLTVWTGASSLGVSSASGITYLTSGALNVVMDGTANQVLGMNAAASGYEYKSILGTANQITVTQGVGSITLSAPQSIAPGSSPTFAGLTISSFSVAGVVHNNASGVLSSSLIVNADVSASAAIAYSKLTLTNSIVNADVSSSAAIVYSKLSLSNSIVNADINASAAIAYSKLSLTGSIVNADVSASAAIVYSKLSLTGSIVNADVSASAAIAYSKLALSNSIVNADINSSAAIAYAKLNLTGSIVNADINAAAAIAYSKLSLTGSIVNADVSTSAAIAQTKLAGFGTAAKTSNYTVVSTDDYLTGDSSGAAFTFTLQAANSRVGKPLTVEKTDTSFNAITITDGTFSTTVNTQGESITVISNGTAYYLVSRTIPQITQTLTMANVVKGSTSDPTLATTPLVSIASFSRIGKYMQLNLAYRQTSNTGAAAGSGQYIFLIPNSLIIDGTYVSTAGTFGITVGSGSFNGSSLSGPVGVCRIFDSTHVTLQASTGQFASTTQPFSDANCEFSITALIPISAWNG